MIKPFLLHILALFARSKPVCMSLMILAAQNGVENVPGISDRQVSGTQRPSFGHFERQNSPLWFCLTERCNGKPRVARIDVRYPPSNLQWMYCLGHAGNETPPVGTKPRASLHWSPGREKRNIWTVSWTTLWENFRETGWNAYGFIRARRSGLTCYTMQNSPKPKVHYRFNFQFCHIRVEIPIYWVWDWAKEKERERMRTATEIVRPFSNMTLLVSVLFCVSNERWNRYQGRQKVCFGVSAVSGVYDHPLDKMHNNQSLRNYDPIIFRTHCYYYQLL